jgi:4-oxalomesaconate hydratase
MFFLSFDLRTIEYPQRAAADSGGNIRTVSPGTTIVTMKATGGGELLVVSAHAADFVWRAAGYIAVVTAAGGTAHVLCLSFGERGESPGAWKQPGMTLDRVKEIRRAEAQAAGDALGATMHFLDKGDYPLHGGEEFLLELAELMRELQPEVILTHSRADPYNYDHPVAAELTLRARVVAQAIGRESRYPPLGAPPVFRFEPHQSEMCEFTPDVLVDITPVFDRKLAAMAAMRSQEHLVSYYRALAERRGVQAVRNGGPAAIRYAEAYQRVFPQVSGVLA